MSRSPSCRHVCGGVPGSGVGASSRRSPGAGRQRQDLVTVRQIAQERGRLPAAVEAQIFQHVQIAQHRLGTITGAACSAKRVVCK